MAALLLFATVAAGIEVHPHREVLGADLPVHGLHAETIVRGASHPASAPHMEAAGGETTLRCPVCLLQLQSTAESTGESFSTVSQAPDGRLTSPGPPLRRAAARLPGGSRAPPASR